MPHSTFFQSSCSLPQRSLLSLHVFLIAIAVALLSLPYHSVADVTGYCGEGTHIDCAGVCGGPLAHDVCGVCDGPGMTTFPTAQVGPTDCCASDTPKFIGEPNDCGICGGSADQGKDDCGVCNGPGRTSYPTAQVGNVECCAPDTYWPEGVPNDCGVCGGAPNEGKDDCGECGGPGKTSYNTAQAGTVTCCAPGTYWEEGVPNDCGFCGGTANQGKDDCGECGGPGKTEYVTAQSGTVKCCAPGTAWEEGVPNDCGICGGTANQGKDCAGTCGGTAVLSGCDNQCNSTKVNDCFGVCGGSAVIGGCDNQCGSTKANIGCGCGVAKQANGCCPGEFNDGCGCNVACPPQSCVYKISTAEQEATIATGTFPTCVSGLFESDWTSKSSKNTDEDYDALERVFKSICGSVPLTDPDTGETKSYNDWLAQQTIDDDLGNEGHPFNSGNWKKGGMFNLRDCTCQTDYMTRPRSMKVYYKTCNQCEHTFDEIGLPSDLAFLCAKSFQGIPGGALNGRYPVNVYLDENCALVPPPANDSGLCGSGVFSHISSPISLVWSTLSEAMATYTVVDFMLDPTSESTQYIWRGSEIFPLLVNDLNDNGIVDNGTELFGTSTEGQIFKHGFEALALRDKDKDGIVSGFELEGLSLWFDANRDARTDEGELVPIVETTVTELYYKGVVSNEGTRDVFLKVGYKSESKVAESVDWFSASVTSLFDKIEGFSMEGTLQQLENQTYPEIYHVEQSRDFEYPAIEETSVWKWVADNDEKSSGLLFVNIHVDETVTGATMIQTPLTRGGKAKASDKATQMILLQPINGKVTSEGSLKFSYLTSMGTTVASSATFSPDKTRLTGTSKVLPGEGSDKVPYLSPGDLQYQWKASSLK